MICIDGSQGEGGGQILRTALSLSAVTGKPFRIEKIRSGRPKPGLLRQHLTAVAAVAQISGAQVTGAAMGSQELTFIPAAVRCGEYAFAVGTAGSTTLVLQTVLPPLMLAQGESRVVLEGGTHNPFAPPFDFLHKAFVPLLGRMGLRVELELQCPGFYPAGGGRIAARIQPAASLTPLALAQRGPVVARRATALVANLRGEIARREVEVIAQRLGLAPEECHVRLLREPPGPGNVVTVEIESLQVTEVFTGFGQKRVSAEEVAGEASERAKRYLESGVPVGEYLADQLLLPMALAGGGEFVTVAPSRHTQTNIEVIRLFLDVAIAAEPQTEGKWSIRVGTAALPYRPARTLEGVC